MYLIDTVLGGSWSKFGDAVSHILLPAFCLSYVYLAIITRIVRSSMIAVLGQDYITTVRANGIAEAVIVPNCISSVIVLATLVLGETILIAASLSFIGLGAKPPTPEWGAMISVGRKFLMDQWWYATFFGLFILLTVIGFNIFADALRDTLDPRIRR